MNMEEQNKLRLKYFRMIIDLRRTGDASALIPFIADDCIWGGSKGKEKVIEYLGSVNTDYKHKSTLVRLGPPPEPLACTDGGGRPIGLSLYYVPGEICMYDVTIHNTLLFRLELDKDGKIRQFYGALPVFFSFHTITE